ncbi:MAG: DUF2341 domain-containing protein, partial [Patescibacteria group bacterium]|nr:DUF2341 domain-containing protein [Patescibacteria group bacterium]
MTRIKRDKSFRIIYSGWYAKEIPIQNLSDSGWKIKKIKKENIKLDFSFMFLNLNNFLIKIKNQTINLFDKYFSVIKNSKIIIFEFLIKYFNKIKNIKFNFFAHLAIKLNLGKIKKSEKIIIESVNKNKKLYLAQNKRILSKQKKNIFDGLQKQFQQIQYKNIFQSLKLKNIFKFWTEKETSKNLFIQRIKQIRKPKLIAAMSGLVIFILISQLIWPAWQGWAFVQEKKWTTAGELTSGTLDNIDSTAQDGSLMISSPSNTWTQTDWSGGSEQQSWSDITKYYSGNNIDASETGTVKINLPTPWYNDSWGYRRKITLTENSTRDLTNYQVRIKLTSSNFDFSKAKSDGTDIRFTSTNGTSELKYWLESYDQSGQTAVVWVKVPSILASTTPDIYIYYGYSGAPNVSDLANTFIFADTFDGAVINTDKWTEYDTGGNYLTQNDKIILSGGSGSWAQVGLVSKTNLSRPFVTEVKLTPKTSTSKQFMIGVHDQTASSNYNNLIYADYFSNANFYWYQDGGGGTQLPAYNWEI